MVRQTYQQKQIKKSPSSTASPQPIYKVHFSLQKYYLNPLSGLRAARCTKILMDAKADPTNPVLRETIEDLQEQDAEIWQQVAENLGKVNRQRTEVNISKIDRVAEDGQTIVVPGKVLGTGRLSKEVNVAAFKASKSAKEKISQNGNFRFIQDLVKENPEGSEVKIVK